MITCRECIFHCASAKLCVNGYLEEEDICTINDMVVDLDRETKCNTFTPYPDRDARRIFK